MIDTVRLERTLRDGARDDAVLARLGRLCSGQFMLATSSAQLHVEVEAGQIKSLERGAFRMRAWQWALRGEDSAWLEFWQPLPRPGFQDIFALSRFGHITIEGDVRPLLRDLRFFKQLLALPRGQLGPVDPTGCEVAL